MTAEARRDPGRFTPNDARRIHNALGALPYSAAARLVGALPSVTDVDGLVEWLTVYAEVAQAAVERNNALRAEHGRLTADLLAAGRVLRLAMGEGQAAGE